ncbi:MAG: reactive intermediate/imine deaminase [Candidatus Dactylopiibacterium carminicum]|nr:MAG: reactive intermediate/imine deaminase [Candidatus Dactylopiibacterium carminicum]
MTHQAISSTQAPAAIGPYSQAVRAGDTVYLSGQIGLEPESGQLALGFEAQVLQVLRNLQAVVEASGGSLAQIVKLNIYLTDLGKFALVNELMQTFFTAPFPARATLGVASLPCGAEVEIDAVLVLE